MQEIEAGYGGCGGATGGREDLHPRLNPRQTTSPEGKPGQGYFLSLPQPLSIPVSLTLSPLPCLYAHANSLPAKGGGLDIGVVDTLKNRSELRKRETP